VDTRDAEKRAAAEAAAAQIEEGMTVGLGTGSTVGFFLLALARRKLSVRCVATSSGTETQAAALGIAVESFGGTLDRLDLAVDGADQVGKDLWLVKGGGGAHTRERIVAAAAARFVVIASSDKLVERVGPPVPLELLRFGLSATLRRLAGVGPVEVREAPATPDDGVLADYRGPVEDPAALAAALGAVPGLVDHGLFPPTLVSSVLVGRGDGTARAVTVGDGKAT
jgi:ribose 5-phosphate isomerase A